MENGYAFSSLGVRFRAIARMAAWWAAGLLLTAGAPTRAGLAMTCRVSPESSLPGAPITVSGTATNTGTDAACDLGRADIALGERRWTTPIRNGAYSRSIWAPATAGVHTVSVTASNGLDAAGGTNTTVTVEPDGTSADWQIDFYATATAAVYGAVSPRSVFTTRDRHVYAHVRFLNFTDQHVARMKWYRPSGTVYSTTSPYYMGTEGVTYPAYSYYSYVVLSNNTSVADVEGQWTVRLYMDDVYQLSRSFTVRYELPQHRVGDGRFLQTDPSAQAVCRFVKPAEGLSVRWKFYDPLLQLFAQATNTVSDPGPGLWWETQDVAVTLPIAGTAASARCGTWRAEVYVQDAWANWDLELTDYFEIAEDTTDSDEDGLTDWEEAITGTSPSNDTEVLTITRCRRANNGATIVEWPTVADRGYRLDALDRLDGVWSNVYQTIGNGALKTYTNDVAAPARFFRVGVTNAW